MATPASLRFLALRGVHRARARQRPSIQALGSFVARAPTAAAAAPSRGFHATPAPAMAIYDMDKVHPEIKRVIDTFTDSADPNDENSFRVGAPWTASMLREKSFDDLHSLWFTLLRERNMLVTSREEARRRHQPFPGPQRLRSVKRSMAAIKVVLGERERETLGEEMAAREDERRRVREERAAGSREDFLDGYPINIGARHHNKHVRGGKRHRDSPELPDVVSSKKEQRRLERERRARGGSA